MEKKENIRNSLGMFDLCKGGLLLFIIFGHSFTMFVEYWNIDSAKHVWYPAFLLFKLFLYGTIPAFFMISGYGFRAKKISSSFKSSFAGMGKQYIFVAIIVVLANMVKNIILGKSVRYGIMYDTIPFLLGICPGNTNIGGIDIGTIGPMWFMIVLFVSWQILNLLYKVINQEAIRVFLIVLMVAFVTRLQFRAFIPYCIVQSCCCVSYLYIGRYMKKKKTFLFDEIKKKEVVLIAIATVFIVIAGNVEVSQNVWKLGFLDYLATCVLGAAIITVGVHYNRKKNVLCRMLNVIGHYSYEILCIHAIEYLVFPWNRFEQMFMGHKIAGVLISFLLRLIIIAVFVKLLIIYRQYRVKVQEKKRSIWKEKVK